MDNLQHRKTKIFGGSTWDNESIAQKQIEYSSNIYQKKMKYQKQYLCFIKVILFPPTYRDIEAIHNNTKIIANRWLCHLKAVASTKDCIIDRIR